MFKRSLMFDDELAHRAVVLAKQTEDLLRLGRFGEAGEIPQVAEDRRNRTTVAVKQLRSVLARDEVRDLGREKTRKLLTLALDGLKELDVRDRDRGLIRKRLQKVDLLLREWLNFQASDRDAADPDAVSNEGHR